MVAVLLDHGAAVDLKGETMVFFNDEKTHDGYPADGPLVAAAKMGYTSSVAMLLRAYAQTRWSPGDAIVTAFEAAVNGAHVDCAKVLLGQGISPDVHLLSKGPGYWDQSITDGNFAMRQTGRGNSVDMARMLVAAGANVDGASPDG